MTPNEEDLLSAQFSTTSLHISVVVMLLVLTLMGLAVTGAI